VRNVNTADLFRAARAVKSSGLRDRLKQTLLVIDKNDLKSAGIDTILTIIEAFAEKGAENALYEVFAGPFEMTADQVASMELSELMDCLDGLAKDPGMADFFKRLSGLIG